MFDKVHCKYKIKYNRIMQLHSNAEVCLGAHGEWLGGDKTKPLNK